MGSFIYERTLLFSMQKRGQVAVFLVIGIVILLLAALFFFVSSKSRTAALQVEEEQTPASLGVRGQLQSYVESCMRETVDPSIYLLASQGGIIYPDENDNILLTDYGMINYAWMNGLEGISKERMEEDLADYLTENIDYCLADFTTFTNQGIVVVPDYEKIKAEINILASVIDLELNFPLEVNLADGDVQEITSFSTRIQSNLGEMLDFVESLALPDFGPEDFSKSSYRPLIMPYDESISIYSLLRTDPEEPLQFNFAVRNDLVDNEPPKLNFIADKAFKIGDRWIEELLAEDPNHDFLKFSSSSSLFPVSDDGLIDVEILTAGIYDFIISVEDNNGEKDQQDVSVLVLE